jgi:hypothetical protein
MNASPELRAALNALLDKIEVNIHPEFIGTINMYIAGGIALNFYCGTRYTEDVDASFSHRITPLRDIEVNYTRHDGTPAILYLDPHYNPSFSLLHPDFEADSIPWDELNGKRRIRVRVLHPLDLALSKISRLSDQDEQDILTLAAMGFITPEKIQARAEEALKDYIGKPDRIRADIRQICQKIEAQKPS